MKIIIVGAGDIGQAVKGRFRNSVLIEADPEKAITLSRAHPGWKIIGGGGNDPNVLINAGIEDAEYLLIATNKDIYSQKVAIAAREVTDNIKIVAVLHDIKNFRHLKKAGVDHLISPTSETIEAILHHLIPVGENITEIAISQHSPALGKTVSEIKLPMDTIIAAILRGHHLVKPEPDTVLQKGDVISLVSLGQLEPDIVDAISGTYTSTVPIENFICLLKSDEDMMILDEILHLASAVTATCRFVFPETMIKFRETIEKRCREAGIEASLEPYMGSILDKFRKIVEDIDEKSNPLIIMPQRKLSILKYHIPPKYIESLVSDIPHPFYIPKTRKYKRFDRILHLIADQHHDGLCASCAVAMARVNNAPLKSLVLHNPENTHAEEILIHTKRIAKVYGIDVVEEVIEGNPTLEFIVEVRESANQLVIINWECAILRRDIMRKIMNEADASVMLMK